MTAKLEPARATPAEPNDISGADTGGVERLFREHNAALVRFISAKVGSEQEAKDIAQQAYVQVLRLDQPGAISFLRAFLFKTAANLAVDRIRQRRRRMESPGNVDTSLAVFELSPERQLAGEQALAVFSNALEELPPKCRLAFLLHRVHAREIHAIAAEMNIGECMVRRYVARALEYIRGRLDDAGVTAYPEPQG